jgi:hypothetical protein
VNVESPKFVFPLLVSLIVTSEPLEGCKVLLPRIEAVKTPVEGLNFIAVAPTLVPIVL